MPLTSKSIFALNTLLCCLGLRMQLIDFHLMHINIKWKYSELFRKYRLNNIPIIFFILFMCKYRSDVSPYIGQSKKSVVYFVSYAFHIGKYLSLVVIYFFQYYNQHKLTQQQNNVRKIFVDMWSINRYLREKHKARTSNSAKIPWYTETININDNYQQVTISMLNVFNFKHFAYILIALLVYVTTFNAR